MSDHATEHLVRHLERHCDVAVVGGSAAGLAAALQLARQRRSVIVVDAGEPRNAPARHMHGYLGYDGRPPGELLAAGREEVRTYGGEVLDGRVHRVTRAEGGGFRVELVGGHALVVRRVLAATGLVDQLPDVEGLAEGWGRDVLHCPFCHGFEVRDRRLVHLVSHPAGLHTAALFLHLTRWLTVVLDPDAGVARADVEALQASGVEVVDGTARRVLRRDDGAVAAVELADGGRLDADAVVVRPPTRVRADAFSPLGLRAVPHASGIDEIVEVDAATGATAIPGVHAAGTITDPSQQVAQAAAHGSRVGAAISNDLAAEDLRAAARPLANAADWDHRYDGDPLWSGNPNGTLVVEVTGLAPGRALDVGAGEGGDAVWLSERGWRVTASDVSQRALDRTAAEAARRGLEVTCLHADANAPEAFARGAFDLVTALYASIPRTPDQRAVRNLLDAVAPGGTLLVVSHDLAPMRAPIDTRTSSRAFDPDAYVTVDHVAAALADASGWVVEVLERRPRPPGAAASAAHHVDDVVLRARRRSR